MTFQIHWSQRNLDEEVDYMIYYKELHVVFNVQNKWSNGAIPNLAKAGAEVGLLQTILTVAKEEVNID